MDEPLRVLVMNERPGRADGLRTAAEAVGLTIEVRSVRSPARPGSEGPWSDPDVIVVDHADPASAARGFPVLPEPVRAPSVIVLEGGDTPDPAEPPRWGSHRLVARDALEDLAGALLQAARQRNARRGAETHSGSAGSHDRGLARALGLLDQELRHIFGAIASAVEVLGDQVGETPAARGRTVAFLDEQCRRMSGVLDQGSCLARAAKGSLTMHPQVIELGMVLERAAERARAAARTDPSAVVLVEPGRPVWVEADADRLDQVLGHAIAHAQRLQGPRAGALEIACRELEDAVEILIGPENPAALPARPAADAGGLDGLLAATLIEHMGGSMRFGPPLALRLPRLEPAARSGDAPERAAPCVLVVDDNADAVRGLGLLLGHLGCRYRVTASASEAMAVLHAFRPELVIIERDLREFEGRHLAHRIRRAAGEHRPTLVGVSSATELFSSDEDQNPAFDLLLPKPLRLEQLMALISGRRAIRARRRLEAPQGASGPGASFGPRGASVEPPESASLDVSMIGGG